MTAKDWAILMAEDTGRPVYVLGLFGLSKSKDVWLAVTDFSRPKPPQMFALPISMLRVRTDFLRKESKLQKGLDKSLILYIRVAKSERSAISDELGIGPTTDPFVAPPGTFSFLHFQKRVDGRFVDGNFRKMQVMKADRRDLTFENHHQEFSELLSRFKAQCNVGFYHYLDSVYDFRRFFSRKRPHIAQLLQAPTEEVKRPSGAALMFGQCDIVDSQMPLFPETQDVESEELSEIEEVDDTFESSGRKNSQPTSTGQADAHVLVNDGAVLQPISTVDAQIIELPEDDRASSQPTSAIKAVENGTKLLGHYRANTQSTLTYHVEKQNVGLVDLREGERSETSNLPLGNQDTSKEPAAKGESVQSSEHATAPVITGMAESGLESKTPRFVRLRAFTSQNGVSQATTPRFKFPRPDPSQATSPRIKSPRSNGIRADTTPARAPGGDKSPAEISRAQILPDDSLRDRMVESGTSAEATMDDCALINCISISTATRIPCTMTDIRSKRDFEICGYVVGIQPHEPFIIKPFNRTLKVAPFKLIVSEEIDNPGTSLAIEFHHELEICTFLLVKEVEEIYSRLELVEAQFYRLIQGGTPIKFKIRRKALQLQNNLLIPYWSCLSLLLDLE